MALDVGELFERYHGVVYRRCLALLRNPDDAAEAVQEVFVRAVKGLGRFHLRSAPLTWLYAIATRHCLQQMRNQASRNLKGPLLGFDDADVATAGRLAARIDLGRVASHLDAAELELAIYAYRDELTQDEIAEVLRISRKTVGKRLRILGDRISRALGSAASPAAVRPAPSRDVAS